MRGQITHRKDAHHNSFTASCSPELASALRQRSSKCPDCSLTNIPGAPIKVPGEQTKFSLLPVHPHFYSGSQLNSFFFFRSQQDHEEDVSSSGDMARKAGNPPNPLDAYTCKCGMRNPFNQGMFCSTDLCAAPVMCPATRTSQRAAPM